MASYKCYRWSTANVLWRNANWTWADCSLVQEIISLPQTTGVDASQLMPKWLGEEETFNPLDIEKKKRFIRLLCKVQGTSYDESKEVRDDVKVTIDDVKLVVRMVAGVELITTEI
jgi:hypothetical protein